MSRKNLIKKLGSRRGRRVTDETCPICGTGTKPSNGRLTVPVNGEEISVVGVPHRSCPSCGESLLWLEEARLFEQTAIETYRKKHRLLTASEIVAIREQYGLTQARLASLLRLGVNTLSRWESGRNVQNAAMDLLLRLIRDRPANLKYLRSRAA